MRNNVPVTTTEYPIHDDTMIVSKTDTKGRLTYFNEQFVAASGFSEEELMGQPHNIIRHPDMPPAAFEDLWKTVKAGKPWAGAVKNRRKNGDFYWVAASVSPLWENGEIVGYTSIRSKLAQDQRDEAERAYSLFRQNKGQSYRLVAGTLRRRSSVGALALLTQSLKARLWTLVSAQLVFVLALGLMGAFFLRDANQRLKTVYEDRAVPLGQLFEINDRMKDDIIVLFNSATGAAKTRSAEANRRVSANLKAVDKVWAEYMATYLTPEESAAATAFAAKRKSLVDRGIVPSLELLAAEKLEEFKVAVSDKANPLFADAKAEMDKLVAIQIKVAAEEYQAAEIRYRVALGMSGALLLLSALLGTLLGSGAIRALSRPLARMSVAMGEIARGRFNSRIIVERDDELGEALRNVQAMQAKLGFDREETRSRRLIADEEKREALKAMASTVEHETNAAVGDVAGKTESMAANASQMNDSASTLGKNSSSVAAAAEEALANAQTLAKAASLMTASIGDISTQISSSRKLTIDAVEASSKAQQTIAKLSQAADRVGAVTSLISEIAGQTNLLALNATIEAARAGDVGRGFAVVASEVKSLAEQTAKATSEIAQQISEIQQATLESVSSIEEIGKVVEGIETSSASISSAMDKQNAVTNEISRTVEESAQAAREVASQIVTVSTEAIETGRRAAEIRDGSAEIASKVAGLRSILVQAVRTSTNDVDRRLNTRIALKAAASLEIAGVASQVIVCNLSLGGALISGLQPETTLGSNANIVIDGLPARLAGVVARHEHGNTLLRFRLTEAAETAVRSFIEARKDRVIAA